jgi:hypothetical protein
MKKLLFAFILAVSMVLTSCDCGCNVEPVELREPEVEVYKMYSPNGTDFNKLLVYKYETPDVYVYRYVISGETKNVLIVPKTKSVQQPQDTESILGKDTYFDY